MFAEMQARPVTPPPATSRDLLLCATEPREARPVPRHDAAQEASQGTRWRAVCATARAGGTAGACSSAAQERRI